MLATPSEHLRPLVRGECGDVRNVVEREVALLERGERAASSSTMPQRAARCCVQHRQVVQACANSRMAATWICPGTKASFSPPTPRMFEQHETRFQRLLHSWCERSIVGCSSMRTLHVRWNVHCFAGELPKELGNLVSLTMLVLDHNKFVTPLKHLQRHFPFADLPITAQARTARAPLDKPRCKGETQ